MNAEHIIREHIAALRQAAQSSNEDAAIAHVMALAAQALVDLNRIAVALEKMALKG